MLFIRSSSSASVSRLAALLSVLWTARAEAAGPLGRDGAPIQTSDYAIDLYQGPVFAGTRVTGLGGAYVAIAEDVDGDLQNPAAPAVRPFYSLDNFDYWLGLGLTLPAKLKGMDIFNSGGDSEITRSPDSFVFVTPALNLQWGGLGIGGTVEVQAYDLSRNQTADASAADISASVIVTHLQVAYGFSHNQWVFGAG